MGFHLFLPICAFTTSTMTTSCSSLFCPQEYGATARPEPSWLLTALSSESVQANLGANAEEETLAEPEIPGLWSEDYKQYQVTAFLCQVLATPGLCPSLLCLPTQPLPNHLLPPNPRPHSPSQSPQVSGLFLLIQNPPSRHRGFSGQ